MTEQPDERVLTGRAALAVARLDDAAKRIGRDLARDSLGPSTGSNPAYLLAHDLQNALAETRSMLTGHYDSLIPSSPGEGPAAG